MTPKNMPPRIESDFYGQLPPLSSSELQRLRENILADGEVYEPIVTWKGIILDGHNRWRVIRENWDKLKDKYHVKEMDFPDKYSPSSSRSVRECMLRSSVEPLCSSAPSAGGNTPSAPSAISAPLKPMTKR